MATIIKWIYDKPTNRQLKVLQFFNVDIKHVHFKGAASGIISSIFKNPANRILWNKYVYITGDNSDDSPELIDCSNIDFNTVLLPEEWETNHKIGIKRKFIFKNTDLIVDLLKEGSPYDYPVPEITYYGKKFVFTGKFDFGSRIDCFRHIENKGGVPQQSVTVDTDYLVIGSLKSEQWASGSFGRKMEKALLLRLEYGSPVILNEESVFIDETQ